MWFIFYLCGNVCVEKKNNLKFYEGYYIVKVLVVNGGIIIGNIVIIMGNIVFLYFLFL